MLRRSSIKPQVVNDENDSNQRLSSKSKSQPVTDSNSINKNQSSVSSNLNSYTTSNRARRVLSVVPDNALNSQQQQSQSSQNYNHQYSQNDLQEQLNKHQQYQQNKTKIPVLVDNYATSRTSTSSEAISSKLKSNENSHSNQADQENFDMSHEIDIDVDIDVDDADDDDVDDDVDDEELIFNEPLSPILTDSIRNEIDRVYSKFSRDTLDPNDEDTYDVTMVAEYGNRIFNYLHSLEIKYKPNPRYIEEIQDDLLWEHRSTLMDWLVQLHSRFNLLPETLYLAVNIIDRFLSKKTISLSRFQLCGAVALFIASKYEEINVPTVSQMVYMVGNQYPRESFLRAERFMVEVLGFEFGWPGPMSFLRRGSKADDYDNEIRTLAKYFLEITIMDARFVSSPPSWLAAGAQFLSRRLLGRGDWTEAHVYYTGYTSEQLLPLAEILEECCISAQSHHRTIFQKYNERRFKRSSGYVQEYLHELYQDI